MRPSLVALALGLACAGPARAAEEVSTFTLKNGLELVVIEDHRAPVVTQMVWYRIGAADEAPGHSGIAHFFEHLMFQGTDDLAPGEFSATVEAQGGNDNAFTSWDYTAYFQRVAADRLDLMMQMEADRMRDLTLSEQDVATERQVIVEERGQRTDSDPGALLREQMGAAQYLNHPYGRPVIGWLHEITALSRDDALAFYRANYAPNNAIVVVAGDVTPDAALKLAETHYGPLEPSASITPRARPSEPPHLSERRIVLQDERVSEPYVVRSYLATERNPGDQRKAAALTLLAELLGGNPTTSVFARELQFNRGVATWSAAFYDGTSVDPATFGVYVMPVPDVALADAEAALDAVIDGFLKDGVDPEELARIKTQVRASTIYGRDNAEGLANMYGQALAVGLTVKDVQDWPDILQSVTEEEIMAAATEVFDKRRAVTGWLQTPAPVKEAKE
ncbi:M16 family metallopeptidase [Tabrizicola oligotrophica]|uniref:Insulinase family protein n=1 Tax=Tabrizicola oligotrophica TaxID=2710650 RepID=A0A6M0QRW4_9RHOB|nr:pitrilysin family protein [Tabrizicola oligotrophica]NEY90177.1 insulinase family protein [Tabrizicola oligotrophica]